MKKSILAILLIAVVSFFGCQKNELAEREIEISKYVEFAQKVKSDLDGITKILKDVGSSFKDKDAVLEAATSFYAKRGEDLSGFVLRFKESFEQKSNFRLSPATERVVAGVESELYISESPEAFRSYLISLVSKVVIDGSLNYDEKVLLVSYLTLYASLLDFLVENEHWLLPEALDKSWWRSALRCAAGTIGSAGLAALTGAGVGTVLPVIGTGAGAIAGGIFGGLVGIATFCL